MITVTNIRNVNNAAYDETWAIVRSLKNPGKMNHVPELSPSWALFKKYLRLKDARNDAPVAQCFIMAKASQTDFLPMLVQFDKFRELLLGFCACHLF